MSRGLKQFLYGLFYLAIIFAVGYGVYHAVVPPPTPPPFGPQTGIQIVENVLTFRLDDGHVGLLAYIQNPSQDYASNYFDYSFSLYDADGNVIKTVPSASFIYSGEAKYLFIPTVNVTSSLVDHSAVVIGTANWVASSTMGAKPKLSFQGLSTATSSDNSGNLVVSGLLVNNDTTPFPQVLVLAVFRDASGHTVGISQTEMDNLGLNESRRFSILHPPLPEADPGATQVSVYALRPL